MGKNYDKLDLGRTLSGMAGDKHNHGDCFNYGSVSGCDENCPALLDSRCEQEEEVLENLGVKNLEELL